jgi:hypothetical protein
MIPAFLGFLFGGGVNPFMSRVATYYLRTTWPSTSGS